MGRRAFPNPTSLQIPVHQDYFDFNTTTPVAPSVLEAMQPFWTEHFALPGQEHRESRAVAEALEQARERVAAMVGCDAFEIVFTASGTEANNLAVMGLANRFGGGHILVSALEHDSVVRAAESLIGKGWQCEIVPVDQLGRVSPATITSMLREDTRLVCVQAANAFLGTVQNIRAIADVCHSHGVPLHCDASQAFGKIPVNAQAWRADTIAISGHKFYGPKGAGALFIRRGYALSPIAFGEIREMGLRPGSENIPALIGLGTAAKLVTRCVTDASEKMQSLRQRFVRNFTPLVHPAPPIYTTENRLPNTILLKLPCDASHVLARIPPIAVSRSRSANPIDEFAKSLAAIGIEKLRIPRYCVLSFGWTTSEEQVDRAVDELAEACTHFAR